MDEKIGFNLLSRAEAQFLVSAMHRVAGLESDDPAPAQARKFSAEFSRSQPQRAKVIVRRHLQALDAAADVPGVGLVHCVIRTGMGLAGAVEDRLRLGLAVGLPDFLDV